MKKSHLRHDIEALRSIGGDERLLAMKSHFPEAPRTSGVTIIEQSVSVEPVLPTMPSETNNTDPQEIVTDLVAWREARNAEAALAQYQGPIANIMQEGPYSYEQ